MIKKIIKSIVICLILIQIQNCANVGNPSGGPQDTIPPKLISSIPKIGQLNYKNKKSITLYFDERVKTDNIRKNLIIIPQNDNRKYKVFESRNKIIMEFDGEFDENTTYSLNFGKSITDITENNPARNLILAFSTGGYIDSLKVKGQVKDLFTQQNKKNIIVGLYKNSDTLDFFKEKPTYFVTTNDSGRFEINYIKSDNYKILAFDDKNKNLLLNSDKEDYAFINEFFNPKDKKDTIQMKMILLDVKPLKLINSRGFGQYFDIKYNKYIKEYQLDRKDLNHQIIGEEHNNIRIYKPKKFNLSDSLKLIIKANDSIDNQLIDTVYLKYTKTKRKQKKISYEIKNVKSLYEDTIKIEANFSKPIQSIQNDSIYITYDTLLRQNLNIEKKWNYSKTKLELNLISNSKKLIEKIIKLDTTKEEKNIKNYGLKIIFGKSSFISIENDTTKQKFIDLHTLKEPEEFGLINVDVTTNKKIYAIQLLKNNKVKYQVLNTKKTVFNKVVPGTYQIRLLIDTNGDKKWTYGNLLKGIEPEDVYVHQEKTAIRANWQIDININVK